MRSIPQATFLATLMALGHIAPALAADQKISAMPAASTPTGDEMIAGVQGGANVRFSPAQMAAFPHLATNTALAAAAKAKYPNGVWRDHYAAGGFADGPVFFESQTDTCAANSLVDDAGSCVDASDGNSWKATFTKLNIKTFGAKGDGSTDDGPAINKAFDYCRATQAGLCEIEFPNPAAADSYVIATPVNCTNFRNTGLRIVLNGAWITGKTSGKPVFDCLQSAGVYFDNLRMTSVSGAEEPSVGVQIGRSAAGESSGWHVFKAAYISGPFTQAPLLVEQSEINTYIGSSFINTDPAADRYGVILDGVNHWDVASDYLTVTLPVDSAESGSFTANVFIGGEIAVGGTTPAGAALWMQHVQDLRFAKTFITDCHNGSIGAQPNVVIRYAGLTAEVLYELDFDGQMECGTSNFDFTGPAASVSVSGLHYRAAIEYATSSVFKKSGSITGVTLKYPEIAIAQNNTANLPLFDTGSAYTVYDVSRIKLDGTSITGFAPTVGGVNCSGIGSGGSPSCALGGGNVLEGYILLTTGSGSTASTGIVDLAFPFKMGTIPLCQATFTNGASAWVSPALVYTSNIAQQATKFTWTNSAALATGSSYGIVYRCGYL